MGVPRSTFYDAPAQKTDDAEIVARITAICEEFECYGYRRVGAELRHQGIVVNAKKTAASCASMTCSRSAADGSSRPPTAIMASPSLPT
jgi:hypothetical protein